MADPTGTGTGTGAVISFLLDSTKEYILYNVNLIDGLNDNIRQLMEDMGEMKAFVKDCTEKYDDDEYLEGLANEVQKVVLQAEDTIEKYIVYKSRQKHRRTLDKTFHIKEYWGELRAVGKECKQVSDKMKKLYQNQIVAIRDIRIAAGSAIKKKRVHTPFEDNIIGFDDVAEDVKKLLTGGSEKLEVHSIVGMVGLGKTTLARKVYLDHKIEYRFFARAFVSVSQVYDKKEVFLKILNNFIPVTDEISKMLVDSVRDKIREELEGKQYLIVLDDVWDKAAWGDLKEVFPMNSKYSRVLITTRDSGVARHANPSVNPYSLRFMKDAESKELLRWKVFGSTGCPGDLESQIRDWENLIIEKCKGLPLAIVVVAGILLDRKTRVDWWKKVYDRVKNSGVDEHFSSELIRYSFNHLPYYMKPCFLYLGVFPEDFDIPVWKLMRLWIAEGFIQGEGNLEDIAERYLEELVDRNLVMVAESKWNGQIKKCRVHDFLREFCKKEAMKKNLFQEVKGTTPVSAEIISADDYIRAVTNYNVLNYVRSRPSGRRVRSFLSFSKEVTLLPADCVQVIPMAFKLLRVLDARAVNFKIFPPELFYLILLKYIAMSCDVETISTKLTNLWNLQTFIFETKSPTLNIKADIWQMGQFRNLHVNTSAILPPVPVQESTQSNLNMQTLSTVAPESCRREVFERCKNLKKLGIRGGNLADFVNPTSGRPCLFDNLSILESLENLKLINGDAKFPLPSLPDYKKFPSNLNKLTLYRTSLHWDDMDTLGDLKNLMVLKLKDSAFVGDFWTVKKGGFGRLSVLHIEKTNLFQWEASSAQFPLLTTLILKHCDRLTSIPRDFVKIDGFQRIELHWTNSKVVMSAKDIQVLKLQMQKKFKLGVYPPDAQLLESHAMA